MSTINQKSLQPIAFELLRLAHNAALYPDVYREINNHVQPIFNAFSSSTTWSHPGASSLLVVTKSLIQYLETSPPSPLDVPDSSQEHRLRNEDWQMLKCSAHAFLLTLLQAMKFQEAVEKKSTRQIYNFVYGLTHEINNPLGNIAARAGQLLSHTHNELDRKSLATIIDQSMRAHEMLAEAMRVVKPTNWSPKPLSLPRLIADCVERLRPQFKEGRVELELELPDRDSTIISDPALLAEAFTDLCKNALDACRPNDKVILSIRSTDGLAVQNQPCFSADEDFCPKGEWTHVSILDTGHGMSPESIQNAMDLYYSGRDNGRGLGISLARVKYTIDQSGGHFTMNSVPNSGTIVNIYLPATTSNEKSKPSISI